MTAKRFWAYSTFQGQRSHPFRNHLQEYKEHTSKMCVIAMYLQVEETRKKTITFHHGSDVGSDKKYLSYWMGKAWPWAADEVTRHPLLQHDSTSVRKILTKTPSVCLLFALSLCSEIDNVTSTSRLNQSGFTVAIRRVRHALHGHMTPSSRTRESKIPSQEANTRLTKMR